jgi:type I restriction enzyme S subunit
MSENDRDVWPTLPLREVAAQMCLGKMLDKEKNLGTLQPYLRNVNVRWFSFDLTDLKEMRFQPDEETKFGLKSGDLVICEGGEPGRAAVWNGHTDNARIQKALHRVRFAHDVYDPFFAMFYLYFGTVTNRFAQHYTGTTIKHLTGKALAQIKFPVPPVNEQRRIVAKLEEPFSDLDAGVAALERAQANLKRYRAAVLKAAVEGRLSERGDDTIGMQLDSLRPIGDAIESMEQGWSPKCERHSSNDDNEWAVIKTTAVQHLTTMSPKTRFCPRDLSRVLHSKFSRTIS